MATKAKDRDREMAQSGVADISMADADIDVDDDVWMEEGIGTGQDALGSKVIVIHPGSQNLRIGLANDPLPKTIPMVIARKWPINESEEHGGEPSPKRMKTDDGSTLAPDKIFDEDVRAPGAPWFGMLADKNTVHSAIHEDVCRPESSHADDETQGTPELQGACRQLQQTHSARENF